MGEVKLNEEEKEEDAITLLLCSPLLAAMRMEREWKRMKSNRIMQHHNMT